MLKVEELKENTELNQYHLGIIVSLMKLKWFISGPSHTSIYLYSTFLFPLQTSNARNLFTNLFVTCNFTMYLIILGDLLFSFFNLKASMHVSSL